MDCICSRLLANEILPFKVEVFNTGEIINVDLGFQLEFDDGTPIESCSDGVQKSLFVTQFSLKDLMLSLFKRNSAFEWFTIYRLALDDEIIPHSTIRSGSNEKRSITHISNLATSSRTLRGDR